ncbi:recombinase family protein [Acuticoccus sediminis]|uniref:recombinase family protein n=1 Tax=Acuticoccus sediminis TaxID=2184697 RepID=UPI001CFE5A5E|nr:recombinase family protein [Acuticoccus sediminis]
MRKKFVAYYRVSTERQGKSGLGLQAQRELVAGFVSGQDQRADLVAEFTEVESGKRTDRPELEKAITAASLIGGTLLIAKLDRLARDAHFLLGLQKAGVDFIACDIPNANRLTVGIMAIIAEEERRMISERTRAALQGKRRVLEAQREALRAEGRHDEAAQCRLGSPNGAAHLRGRQPVEGTAAVKANAQARAEALRATLDELRHAGITSANGMAIALNDRGVLTARGGRWTARSVMNVLQRL